MTTALFTNICVMDEEKLLEKNVIVEPRKPYYFDLDSIRYSCKPGYYLQRPSIAVDEPMFDNICLNGHWKWNTLKIPQCAATCKAWNYNKKSWDSIVIHESDIDFTYIYSPNYPNSIPYNTSDCVYRIRVTNATVKLFPIFINVTDFYLNVTTEHGQYIWSNNSYLKDDPPIIQDVQNVDISLMQRSDTDFTRRKLEMFKLMVKINRRQCKLRPLDSSVLVNRTVHTSIKVIESYMCLQPYQLVGPQYRRCQNGVWKPLQLPSCKFFCQNVEKVYLTNSFEFQTDLMTLEKCTIYLYTDTKGDIVTLTEKSAFDQLCVTIKSQNDVRHCRFNGTFPLYFTTPVSFSFSVIQNSEVPHENGLITIQMAKVSPRYCGSFHIENGSLKRQNLSVTLSSLIDCNPGYYLVGSNVIRCVLLPNGTALWTSDNKAVCIKICREEAAIVEMVGEPLYLPYPPFIDHDFSKIQYCQWKIMSKTFNPLIEIRSSDDIRKYVNLSILRSTSKSGNFISSQALMEEHNQFKLIFICPESSCLLKFFPLNPVRKWRKEHRLTVTVKFADHVSVGDSRQGIYFTIIIFATFITLACIIFIEYNRRPITGCTAKFLKVFKTSNLKLLSSFTVIDISSCAAISKTEADIIVFYTNHHPEAAHIEVRRSLPCIYRAHDDINKRWRHKLNIVKRRFSDITDLVIHTTTERSSSVRKASACDSVSTQCSEITGS